MADSRGYDERSHLRIQSAVHKIERLTQGLPNSGKSDPRSVLRRVKLAGTLSATVPTTGTLRLQAADGATWIDSTIIIGEIYSGSDSIVADSGDDVWVIPMQHRWYALSLARSSSSGGSDSSGCCFACIDCGYMQIDGIFARRYKVRGIPIELGGDEIFSEVTLHYVGLASGLTGIPDNAYLFESAAFAISCDAGNDVYFWRMAVLSDGTAICKADGSENAKLYIVRVSSAAVCADLTAVNCDTACSGGETSESGGGGSCACATSVIFTVPDPFGGANTITLPYSSGCIWSDTSVSFTDATEGTCTGSVNFNADTGGLYFNLNTTNSGETSAVYFGTTNCAGTFSVSLSGQTGAATYTDPLTLTGA